MERKASGERLNIRDDKNERKWLFGKPVRFDDRVLPLLIKYGAVEKWRVLEGTLGNRTLVDREHAVPIGF
ncbi:MAG: hypothetical protein AAF468_03365 [Pseudomonadota bacterium]